MVYRNAALGAITGVLLWQGPANLGSGFFEWLKALSIPERAVFAAIVAGIGLITAGSWLSMHLLRQNGRLLVRIEALEAKLEAGSSNPIQTASRVAPAHGLPIGTLAPAFELPSVTGDELSLATLVAKGQPVLLIFTDPGCGPCRALLPEIAGWQKEYAGMLEVVLISRIAQEVNYAKLADLDQSRILLQRNREVAQEYQCTGTPGAVLVRQNGEIGTRIAMGAEAIKDLVTTVSRASASGTGSKLIAAHSRNGNNGHRSPQLSGAAR